MEIKTSNQESGEPFLLSPRLPYHVVDVLLDYLDFFTLKTLRLVCKKSKSWVETPELLRHFVVRITGKARINEVLRASESVPWNSFAFSDEYSAKCFSTADIQRFLAAYGNLVLHLDLTQIHWGPPLCDAQQAQMVTQSLLSGCPHLESFQSHQLTFRPHGHDQLTRQLLGNWKNLQHFNVHQFVGDYRGSHREMTFFSQILSTCTQLKTLTVPYFTSQFLSRHEFDYTESFEQLVVTPLLDTIAQGRLRSIRVSADGPDVKLFLVRLAIACREKRIVLQHVGDRFLETFSPEHYSVLDSIGNLSGVNDAIIRQPLKNVRSIWLSYYNFRIENIAYDMPLFPYLKHLYFDFRCSDQVQDGNSLELFVNRLAEVKRPSVETLTIIFPVNISPPDLCASFVNLRMLYINDWKGEDEEWLQLWHLVGQTLEKLWVIDCPSLTDRGILGDDPNQAAILKLKFLHELKLSKKKIEPDKITDLSFIHGFRHMRLRSFVFNEGTPGNQPPRLLAKTVMEMWSGAIGESVEEFFVQVNLMPTRPSGKWRSSTYEEEERRRRDKRRNVCDPNGSTPAGNPSHNKHRQNRYGCCFIM